jgi:hypothetical protein
MRYISEESADEVLRLLPISHCWRGVSVCRAPFDAVTPSRRASAYALRASADSNPPLARAASGGASRDDLSPPGEGEGARL